MRVKRAGGDAGPLKRVVRPRSILVNHGISFDLHQPLCVDEARYLHYRVGRTYVPEEFAVHLGHRLPVINPREENSSTYDKSKRGSRFPQCRGDDFKTATGLCRRITQSHSAAVRPKRSSTRDRNDGTRSNRT